MLSMATITPKEKDGKIIAYKFRACVGRDENGKQVSRATTWKIPENLSMTRLTSAAQRAAADWEKQARSEYEKDLYDPERIKAREVDRPSVLTTGSASPKRYRSTTTPPKILWPTSKGKSSRKSPPRTFKSF